MGVIAAPELPMAWPPLLALLVHPVVADMKDLFGAEIVDPPMPSRGGHAAKPGTGPSGETCGTCRHRVHTEIDSGKKYQKCMKIRANWTHGPGTDIKKKDKACACWTPIPSIPPAAQPQPAKA